jgi:hypothetical protein
MGFAPIVPMEHFDRPGRYREGVLEKARKLSRRIADSRIFDAHSETGIRARGLGKVAVGTLLTAAGLAGLFIVTPASAVPETMVHGNPLNATLPGYVGMISTMATLGGIGLIGVGVYEAFKGERIKSVA